MMERLFLAIGFHLLFINVFMCQVEADNRREDLIQDSVRRLLGVKPDIDRAIAPGKNSTSLPPRYVMDLYEKYRSGHAPMQGNTVRSILPMRDTIGEADVLIFNLTGIKSDERILQSKLYLLKRRRPKPGKKREGSSHFRIKIGTLPHMTSHRFVEMSLTRHKSEWHSYDITESVVQCRQHTKNGDYLLGVTLEVKRPKGSYRLSPFRRLLKHDSQPFVLIFSEDENNKSRNALKTNTRNTNGGFQNILQTQAKHDLLGPGNLSEDERLFQNRPKRSIYQPITFSNNSTKTLLQKYTPRKYLKTSRSSPNLGIFHELDNLKTNINMEKIWNENNQYGNFLFKKFRLLSDVFLNIWNPSAVNKSKEFTLYNSSKGLKRPIVTETFSAMSEKYGNVSKESSVKQSVDIFEKVLLQNLDWSIENYSAHENISKGTVQTEMYKSAVVMQRPRSKRSVPGISVTSKEYASSDTVANTFQTLGKRYGNRLNSSASARRRNRQRSQSLKKPRKKRRRNNKLPFWWTKHDSRLHSQDYGTLCQRKSLVVDFVKLGWGDWVMSPKSFNAHYCSGGCSFPLIKNANPSNHAAIQSLVHAIGLSPNIPTPCCVPSASSPLTLLYFDEHGNLVLKNYPNMIVEKCACR